MLCCSFCWMLDVDVLLFFLLNVVAPFAWRRYYSSCSTLLLCCFSCSMLLLYNSSCLTLLFFLLDVVVIPLAQHDCFACSMLLFFALSCTFLLHLWCCWSLLLGRYCCFYSSCFKLVLSLFSFCKCGKSCPNLSSQSQNWKMRFFFPTFVWWWIFLITHVFGKCWLTMRLFVVCKNYLNIIHLIIHIASHLHNCIMYFCSRLHLFFYGHKKCRIKKKEI